MGRRCSNTTGIHTLVHYSYIFPVLCWWRWKHIGNVLLSHAVLSTHTHSFTPSAVVSVSRFISLSLSHTRTVTAACWFGYYILRPLAAPTTTTKTTTALIKNPAPPRAHSLSSAATSRLHSGVSTNAKCSSTSSFYICVAWCCWCVCVCVGMGVGLTRFALPFSSSYWCFCCCCLHELGRMMYGEVTCCVGWHRLTATDSYKQFPRNFIVTLRWSVSWHSLEETVAYHLTSTDVQYVQFYHLVCLWSRW